MKYILYDLEALGKRDRDHDDFMEIVEIAAIKVEVSHNKARVIDSFQSFVKPVFHKKITKKLHKLLSFTEQDLQNAPGYDKALSAFYAWAGDDVIYVSWGHDEDMIYTNNMKHYLFDYSSMDCLDLQFIYDMHNDKKLRTGLKTALQEQNYTFEGQQHTALDDAKNMLPLFQQYLQDIRSYFHSFNPNHFTANVAFA